MRGRADARALVAVAAVSVALHLLGSGLALGALARGSPPAPLDARLAYLAARPIGWSLGWSVWMLCALALVAFLAVLVRHAPQESRDLASLGVVLAAAGGGVDLLCDCVQVLVLPDLAAWKPPDPPLFFAFERAAGAGGTVAANGLYSVAVLLSTLALRRRVALHASGLGLTAAAAGGLLVLAGASGEPRTLPLAAGATIVAFLLWTVDLTLCLRATDRS